MTQELLLELADEAMNAGDITEALELLNQAAQMGE